MGVDLSSSTTEPISVDLWKQIESSSHPLLETKPCPWIFREDPVGAEPSPYRTVIAQVGRFFEHTSSNKSREGEPERAHQVFDDLPAVSGLPYGQVHAVSGPGVGQKE